jgi:dolichol-phosphate mannosyltransferase
VTPERPLVSVVLSFRNEQDVLPELVARLQRALKGADVDYELVFVNDASTDGSLAVLEQQRRRDPAIKIINMSRRFGVAPCVLAGMRHARGDAVVYMDADLQDPPELLPELVRRWREGADVVYTVRTTRAGESRAKLWITRAAYHAIAWASRGLLPVEAADFKLLSRRVVDRLIELEEQDPYLRGLVTWLGFRQVAVPYERQPRGAGRSHFPLLRSTGPAEAFATGLTSFSHVPLVFFLLLGLAGCALAALGLVTALVLCVAGAALPDGSGLALLGLLLWSTIVLGIGVLGLYLGKIHSEVLDRPRYIVESTQGFDDER